MPGVMADGWRAELMSSSGQSIAKVLRFHHGCGKLCNIVMIRRLLFKTYPFALFGAQ
jgi:hypothetical protein